MKPKVPKASESFMLLNSKELAWILIGWQGTDVLYRYLGVEFRLKREPSLPRLLQTEICWPRKVNVLLYAL